MPLGRVGGGLDEVRGAGKLGILGAAGTADTAGVTRAADTEDAAGTAGEGCVPDTSATGGGADGRRGAGEGRGGGLDRMDPMDGDRLADLTAGAELAAVGATEGVGK